MVGLTREKGLAGKKKSALTMDILRDAINALDGSLRGTRDRALLLLGFGTALRRSEIAALDFGDLKFSRDGVLVTIRFSKTDQAGAGAPVALPYVSNPSLCGVRAVKAWIAAAGIESGPLFRTIVDGKATDQRIGSSALARVIQKLCKGLDGDFGGHSLRAGFVTSAAEEKFGFTEISAVTRHRSQQVLAGYIRSANAFKTSPMHDIVRTASRRQREAKGNR